jgi:hypothetical protein
MRVLIFPRFDVFFQLSSPAAFMQFLAMTLLEHQKKICFGVYDCPGSLCNSHISTHRGKNAAVVILTAYNI